MGRPTGGTCTDTSCTSGSASNQIEVVLLDVLAVVAFAVRQAEQAFLEDRILAVPQRERKAQELLVVRYAGKSIFTPAVRSRARLIVGEAIPRVARLAIVFAHRAPLAFAQVRSPLPPGDLTVARVRQPQRFGTGRWVAGRHSSPRSREAVTAPPSRRRQGCRTPSALRRYRCPIAGLARERCRCG